MFSFDSATLTKLAALASQAGVSSDIYLDSIICIPMERYEVLATELDITVADILADIISELYEDEIIDT